MAGKHSKRRGVHARIPAQRGPIAAGIELADALTNITHRVEPDELVAGEPSPGTLVTGELALKRSPADPDHICPDCRRAGGGGR